MTSYRLWRRDLMSITIQDCWAYPIARCCLRTRYRIMCLGLCLGLYLDLLSIRVPYTYLSGHIRCSIHTRDIDVDRQSELYSQRATTTYASKQFTTFHRARFPSPTPLQQHPSSKL
ncbi:hypothetical protein BO94DRAFT_224953 [Aspergillus sclerotioniger CBS 115572]|uniref:Uncharacterized protein n=1 Tax=Aspergillus sclerotioniger CBS 115572 TaxID=1450535 RepID=A0A317XF53_9EURO|nr:hypothetical protein BO94DRAFT_224953 [Aspergillus sclerotioniger CBS 115572]PWY95320.1 hypothetical protein BO94DRAFT_224953 [Aspergillus sclerotioniger CBS 115572]